MDLIDKKIVDALSHDSRQSRTKLARKLRISKSTLLYRISKLEKGVFKSYVTIIDHSSSNNMYVRVAVKGKVPRQKFMTFYAQTHGMYDVVFSFYAQTLSQAQSYLDKIRTGAESLNVSFALHFYTCFPSAFGLTSQPVISSFSQRDVAQSETQLKILETLEEDPSITVNAMAMSLSLSAKTVVAHKKKLEREKTILKYSVVMNPARFGFEQAHIYWSDSVDSSAQLLKYLISHPKIVFVTCAFGGKTECEYLFESHKDLHDFFSDVKQKFGVTAESYFVYN